MRGTCFSQNLGDPAILASTHGTADGGGATGGGRALGILFDQLAIQFQQPLTQIIFHFTGILREIQRLHAGKGSRTTRVVALTDLPVTGHVNIALRFEGFEIVSLKAGALFCRHFQRLLNGCQIILVRRHPADSLTFFRIGQGTPLGELIRDGVSCPRQVRLLQFGQPILADFGKLRLLRGHFIQHRRPLVQKSQSLRDRLNEIGGTGISRTRHHQKVELTQGTDIVLLGCFFAHRAENSESLHIERLSFGLLRAQPFSLEFDLAV